MISATAVAKNNWSRIVPRLERSIVHVQAGEPAAGRLGRSRRADERSLSGVAAKRQQPGDHRRGLDTLGNDRQSKVVREIDRRADDHLVLAAFEAQHERTGRS